MIDGCFRILKKLFRKRSWELSRYYFSIQYRRGLFVSYEEEYRQLDDFILPGMLCMDIGANVGRFTLKMADLCGPEGHVFSFEPVPEIFDTLSYLVRRHSQNNVSLFNTACGEKTEMVSLERGVYPLDQKEIIFDTLTASKIDPNGDRKTTLSLRIDELTVPAPIGLIKIDVEGYELKTLQGLEKIIRRDKPILIVENNDPRCSTLLKQLGYSIRIGSGSRNIVAIC